MSLSEAEHREVTQVAELEVRRYFDHYLNEVFPEQAKSIRAHTHQVVEKHNLDPEAHEGVAEKVKRAKWVVVGALAVGGGLGAIGKAVLGAIVGS